MSDLIPHRLGLLQRVVPSYRVPFFEALAQACSGGLSLFAGEARVDETIESGAKLLKATQFTPAQNRHIFSGSLYLCWQSGLIEWLEKWQPEALIVEANPRYLRTSAAVNWMHARQRPVFGWGLGSPAAVGAFSRLRRAARRRFLNQFDGLLVYSRQGAEQYAALGFPAVRIYVAPNAAAPRPVQPPPPRPDFITGSPVVLFVGRLQARKRLDLLFQACAKLPPPLRPQVWVVGEGSIRGELEKIASQIYPQTRFFGTVHGVALEPLYAQADLFVLPGTGGLAVQQAMAHALPVIMAEGDGTQSDLVRPQNGWQVQPGNLESLVSALQQALSDLPRLRRMGTESFQVVAEEVNIERMVEGFARAIKGVI